MSLLFQNKDCCVLDHQSYISKIYNRVVNTPHEYRSFSMLRTIFSISNDHTSVSNSSNPRKRKKGFNALLDEASMVKNLFETSLKNLPLQIIDYKSKNKSFTTPTVRTIAKEIFESTTFEHKDISGGNNSNLPIKCKINNDCFLIPQNSRFFCGDVTKYCNKLDGQKFDIVIADPPWWNKYIRRLKAANSKLSYAMMYNEEISLIPLKNLLANNCLVAVWCTNSPSNVSALKDLIFPKWGVEYVTTWYWLKVGIDFNPICEFGSGCKKQPYERIIIGKVGDVKNIPKSLLVISVPSALHSHKPPLLDVLKQYIDVEHPQALELFARYLLPNTTSVGYEPIKWQHISLYEMLDDDKLVCTCTDNVENNKVDHDQNGN